MTFEMLAFDLLFECRTQFAFAKNHEPSIRDSAEDDRGSINEMVLALLRDERADVTDDRRMSRKKKCGMYVGRWKVHDALDVNALMDDGGFLPRDAVRNEPIPNGLANCDETGDASVLPFRKRVVRDPELDASRRDERRFR